jgi:hypothetical protein
MRWLCGEELKIENREIEKGKMTMPETNELIRIFVKSNEITKKNHANETPTK